MKKENKTKKEIDALYKKIAPHIQSQDIKRNKHSKVA